MTLKTLISRSLLAGLLGAGLMAAPMVASAGPGGSEDAHLVPAIAVDLPAPANGATQTVIFSGGCFWGVQGVFQHIKGVKSAVSGYTGGAAATAHYEVVSTGVTGHAESVKVTYDPKMVSFGQLMRVFFSVATDPTQLNQQFPDHGTQYRNAIWTSTPEQLATANAYIAQLDKAKTYAHKIVTKVQPAKAFYPAEDYHQDFLTLNPDQLYIATYDMPKIQALKTLMPDLYKAMPTLVRPSRS